MRDLFINTEKTHPNLPEFSQRIHAIMGLEYGAKVVTLKCDTEN